MGKFNVVVMFNWVLNIVNWMGCGEKLWLKFRLYLLIVIYFFCCVSLCNCL